jgi:hypothetical protein
MPNVMTLEYLLLPATAACVIYFLLARWYGDIMWEDGYTFALAKLARAQKIMPHERQTGQFALGVLAAEQAHLKWQVASGFMQNSTVSAS